MCRNLTVVWGVQRRKSWKIVLWIQQNIENRFMNLVVKIFKIRKISWYNLSMGPYPDNLQSLYRSNCLNHTVSDGFRWMVLNIWHPIYESGPIVSSTGILHLDYSVWPSISYFIHWSEKKSVSWYPISSCWCIKWISLLWAKFTPLAIIIITRKKEKEKRNP